MTRTMTTILFLIILALALMITPFTWQTDLLIWGAAFLGGLFDFVYFNGKRM